MKALKEQKKSLKDGTKDAKKEKEEKKGKKDDEKKDSGKESGEEGLEVIENKSKNLIPREAWGFPGAVAGSHDGKMDFRLLYIFSVLDIRKKK